MLTLLQTGLLERKTALSPLFNILWRICNHFAPLLLLSFFPLLSRYFIVYKAVSSNEAILNAIPPLPFLWRYCVLGGTFHARWVLAIYMLASTKTGSPLLFSNYNQDLDFSTFKLMWITSLYVKLRECNLDTLKAHFLLLNPVASLIFNFKVLANYTERDGMSAWGDGCTGRNGGLHVV